MKRVIVFLSVFLVLILAGCNELSGVAELSDEYEGAELTGPAPDFNLFDQNNELVRLSDNRGKIVILTFMESRCQEVCPLTASELRKAYQTLGSNGDSVVLIGINVNVEANKIDDVSEATLKWHLDEIPNWHFLTGTEVDLKPVWEAYGVAVVATTDGEEEIMHSTGVFLIDEEGEMVRYISVPMDEEGVPQIASSLSELIVKHVQALLDLRK